MPGRYFFTPVDGVDAVFSQFYDALICVRNLEPILEHVLSSSTRYTLGFFEPQRPLSFEGGRCGAAAVATAAAAGAGVAGPGSGLTTGWAWKSFIGKEFKV